IYGTRIDVVIEPDVWFMASTLRQDTTRLSRGQPSRHAARRSPSVEISGCALPSEKSGREAVRLAAVTMTAFHEGGAREAAAREDERHHSRPGRAEKRRSRHDQPSVV